MKLGVLFSGGKDSVYSAYFFKKKGYDISCLITLESINKDSYMFHTPSINKTKYQAKEMRIPHLIKKTKGEKEEELKDLEKIISLAIKKYKIQGIVTGAVLSVYQSSRIKNICDKLGIGCLNPLWGKDELNYLKELLKNNFEIMIVSVAAYPLNPSWLGRIIDNNFIKEIKELKNKYSVSPAGEGGEFETFVINCPMFKKRLKIKKTSIKGKDYSWKMEFKIIEKNKN